jgi:peptidoglycan L-alanyl-D-glutamate endopeptidase CwlK
MITLSDKSKERLSTCCEEIQKVINHAANKGLMDFTVLCGHRTEKEQTDAFMKGNSKAKFPQSSHNRFPSIAVDLAPYPIDWNDTERFKALGRYVLDCAKELNIQLYWGGNWKGFIDYPHFSTNNK